MGAKSVCVCVCVCLCVYMILLCMIRYPLSIVRYTTCKVSRFIMFTETKECFWSNGADFLAAPAQSKEGEADWACETDQGPH